MGIMLTTSSVYTPQSNGLAERMNRTLLNTLRSMLAEARIDNRFWGETAVHVAELQNLTVTPVLNMRTPIEAIIGHAFDNSKLRTFGWAAYIDKHKERRAGKPDNRSELSGYLSTAYGQYRIYMPMTRTVGTSKRVYPLASKHEVHNEIEEQSILDNTPQTSLTLANSQINEKEVVRKINQERYELSGIDSE